MFKYIFKPDEKQQEQIAEFFKRETKYFPNQVLMKYLACLFVGISMLFHFVPVQTMEEDAAFAIGVGLYFYCMGVVCYATKYSSYAEASNKQAVRVSVLLQYLPVEKEQLSIFRIRKILKPCIIATLVSLFFRVAIALGYYHDLTITDALIRPLCMIVLPVLLEGSSPWGFVIMGNKRI